MATAASVLERYPDYEATIGIEVHVQLTTKSKIFCSCNNTPCEEPNCNICDVCSGYPGALPVLNKQAVDFAILSGLATNCSISTRSHFDRKHYFYPDLPKDYQITQQADPICTEGFLSVRLGCSEIKKVRLIRIHMEEDAGKNVHSSGGNESFVDLNRAGTPLLEIVSYPDMSNAEEARAYLKGLRLLVRYLGVCSGNMEEGAFRADTNISVRKKGEKQLGTRCELKNINSFKFIGDAIEYEIERQIEMLKRGERVLQETRLWDTRARETVAMRSKEDVADYRYFEDPDLPLIEVNEEWIGRVRKLLPELPHEKFERFCREYSIGPAEAEILIEDVELSAYFERASKAAKYPRQIINWVLRDVMAFLKEEKIELIELKMLPEQLATLVDMVEGGVINNRAAQEVFKTVAKTGQDPREVVKEAGLEQLSSTEELEAIVSAVLAECIRQVEEYQQSGNERMFGFFVGAVMKKTGGRANPVVLREILKKRLG